MELISPRKNPIPEATGSVDMEIVIQNRQRFRPVDAGDLAEFIHRVVDLHPPEHGNAMTVRIVSDRKMSEFNLKFRGRGGSTDVLSFPGDGDADHEGKHYLGDILISAHRADEQARVFGHDLSRELKVLVLHGYLHLLGYDHETDRGQMLSMQRMLVRRLIGGGRNGKET